MTETIEVRYKPVIMDGINLYHKYIIYTDSSGTQYYSRGARVGRMSAALSAE